MRQTISLLLTLLAFTQLLPARVAARPASQEVQAARAQQQQTTPDQPLRNADVEALLDAGISPEVVAAKIRASVCEFDASPPALQRLKAKGAADAVLLAVIEVAAQPARTAAAPATQTARVKLPAGTPVEVETVHAINSAEVRAGDALSLRVTKAVEVGGLTVIEAGAHAAGRVVRAKRGRPFGKAGQIMWQMEYVVAVDGQKIPLSFAGETKGHSKSGTVATAAVITAVMIPLAAPVGLLWGFKRGKSAVVPAGKIFAPAVAGDAHVVATARPAN
jgi:hypothetical protein